MIRRLWQGFDHRWTTLPHRVGGLGASLRPDGDGGTVRMAPGQDADVGRAGLRWARVEVPGATHRRVRAVLEGLDAREGDAWTLAVERTIPVDVPPGHAAFAVLAGFDWVVTLDGVDGIAAVWAHHFELGLATTRVGDTLTMTARLTLAHADAPDPLKAPGAERWHHRVPVVIDVLFVPQGTVDEALVPVHARVPIDAGAGSRPHATGGIPGLTRFGWRLSGPAGLPAGRYLDRYSFHLEAGPELAAVQARVGALLPASAFVKDATFDGWVGVATLRAPGARLLDAGWIVGRTRRADGYTTRLAFPEAAGVVADALTGHLVVPEGLGAAPLVAGAAKRPIALPTAGKITTAGYSIGSPAPKATSVALDARALVLEHADGGPLALVALDVHAGTRLLFEEIAKGLAERGVPIPRARLVVSGTHTHTGPARIYGSPLYDAIAGGVPVPARPQPAAWKPVVAAAVDAVADAWAVRRPARVGYAATRTRGLGHQRSHEAFPFADEWNGAGWPGEGLDGDEFLRFVDPRVRGWVVRGVDGALIAAHATVACHNTALGFFRAWDPDFVGRGATEAEKRLGGVVLVGLSGAGDQSPLGRAAQLAKNDDKGQGPPFAEKRAGQLADALEALVAQVPVGEESTLATWFLDWEPAAASPARPAPGAADLRLAPRKLGHAMAGGAEDYRSCLYPGLAKEKVRRKDPRPPEPAGGRALDEWLQWPKVPVAWPFQRLLDDALPLATRHPVHVVSLAGYTLATLPGEPTAALAWTIERALRDGAHREVGVLGYTGDYVGYLTTESEYLEQHYEGAATLYGRNTGAHLLALIRGLVTEPANRPLAAEAWRPEAPPPGYDPRIRSDDVAAWSLDGRAIVVSGSPLDAAELAAQGLEPARVLDTPIGTLHVASEALVSPETALPRETVTVTVNGTPRTVPVEALE